MAKTHSVRLAFFHGLESDGPGAKGDYLKSISAELFAPRIDYRNPSEVNRLWQEAIAFKPDVVLGSSMGGWFALHLSAFLDVPAVLVNPALVGRSFDPISLELSENRPLAHVLLGKLDEQISGDASLEWLTQRGIQPHVDWIEEGHRISSEAFERFSSQALYTISEVKRYDRSEFSEQLHSQLKLGPLEQSLAHAVMHKFYTKDAICTYSGGGLPHGQSSAHRRWTDELDLIEAQLNQVQQNALHSQAQLKEFKEQLNSMAGEPDWTDPRVRRKMLDTLSSIARIGSVLGSSAPFKRRGQNLLPQTTPIVYHDVLSFFNDRIQHVNLKSERGLAVDSALIEAKRIAFNVDFKSPTAPNPRIFRRVSYMAIPKHISGKDSYAVTASVGKPYPRDRSYFLHYWSAMDDGTWLYDGFTLGKLGKV